MRRSLLAFVLCALAVPVRLSAQAQPQTPDTTKANTQERLGENHVKLTGNVELSFGDSMLFADQAELFQDQHRVIATGNVVVTQGKNRIAADRADFNTETRLGTFYHATGIASVPPPKQQPPPPGGFAPPVLNIETDVYFYGDKVEKVGLKKYKITNGGFTTCVQPTPRWQLTSGMVILNVDHYTFMRNAIFSVKGVPFLWTPLMYYPTKKDGRATGFLIPTYGESTIFGSAIHNAFFWAINRSQDLTALYDYYTSAGQGTGAEYRYNYGAAANGNLRFYSLDQKANTFTDPNTGQSSTLPASQSFEVRGGANQSLPFNLKARANVDYFSSVQEAQTFSVNMYNAAPSQRVMGGNIVGTWGTYNLNVTIDRNETFYSSSAQGTTSNVQGDGPRIAFTRSERPLWPNSPIYFSVGGEYADLISESIDTITPSNDVDHNVQRLDFNPQIRYPFKKWEWFTVNSTAGWRDTFYSRTLAPTTDPNVPSLDVVDQSLNRRFFQYQSQIVGPVFDRIWDTPKNHYAEKFKHTIEPFFNISRTSQFQDYDRIIQTDQTDTIIPGTTELTYGVNNRIYAKRRGTGGRPAQAREILTIGLTQSYYSNPIASQFDTQYMTSFSGAPPSNFSPIALTVRAVPTTGFDTTFRAEFDSRYHTLRTMTVNASYAIAGYLQESLGWTKTYLIPQLIGFNDPNNIQHYLNASTSVHTKDNRVGTSYVFNYDIFHSSMTQQNISIFYNAQCCGIAFQYQSFNYGDIGYVLPADQRFFLSFTLAGIGNFSPFNGAMANTPH